MLIIFLRTVIIYFVLLIAMRLMGKSELSSMSPFQLVIIYMIAELATIPIDDTNVTLFHGIIGIFTLVFVEVIISFISMKSEWFRQLIKGKPSLIIEDGKINMKAMKDLRLNMSDFMQQLRIANKPVMSSVDYAVIEANGNLTVQDKEFPLMIICQGHVYEDNLALSGIQHKDLRKKMKQLNIKSYSEIFLAFSDNVGVLHIYVMDNNKIYAREVK